MKSCGHHLYTTLGAAPTIRFCSPWLRSLKLSAQAQRQAQQDTQREREKLNLQKPLYGVFTVCHPVPVNKTTSAVNHEVVQLARKEQYQDVSSHPRLAEASNNPVKEYRVDIPHIV